MFSIHPAKRLIAGILLVTAPIIAMSAPASAYDRATIYNWTKNTVTGTVHYVACRSDAFTIPAATNGPIVNQFQTTKPTHTTMSANRGACLISKIEAKSGNLAITPFQSHGSTKSQFRIDGFPPNANGMTGAISVNF